MDRGEFYFLFRLCVIRCFSSPLGSFDEGFSSSSQQKPLGQQFKKEVHIRNLPSLFKKVKPNKDIVTNSENAGLVSLFSPEHDDD